jgi:hypothetical protein
MSIKPQRRRLMGDLGFCYALSVYVFGSTTPGRTSSRGSRLGSLQVLRSI